MHLKAPVKIVQGELDKVVDKINKMAEEYSKENKIVGIMATDETLNRYIYGLTLSLGSRNSLESIAQNLFETLRTFDDKKVDVIISESFEENGIGIAIMNRLKKSAGFDIIHI